MTNSIASLSRAGTVLCADREQPGNGRRGRYACLWSPADGAKTDLTKKLGLKRSKCTLYVGASAVASTSMTLLGNCELAIVDGATGERRVRCSVDLDETGFLSAIDPDASMGFFRSLSGRATLRSLEKGLPLLAQTKVTGVSHPAFISWCQGHFVTCTNDTSRNQVAVIDSAGRTQATYKLPRELAHMSAAADAPLVACGLIGGGIRVLELGSKTPLEFAPHARATRDDWPQVEIDPAGRFLLSWLGPGGTVQLTDLASGESSPLLDLPMLATREELRAFEERLPNPLELASGPPELPSVPDLCIHQGELLSMTGKVLARWGDPLALPAAPAVVTGDGGGDGTLTEELLERFRSPAVQLAPRVRGHEAASGCRVGGVPELPRAAEWPHHEGRPMTFLAQLDLAECHGVEGALLLPAEGRLAFFVATDEYGWPEMDEPTYGAARVLFVPPGVEVTAHEAPGALSDEQRLAPWVLEAVPGGLPLPREGSAAVESWQLGDEALRAYRERVEALEPGEDDTSPTAVQLMGYPQFVQSDAMEWQIEAISRGANPWRPDGLASAAEAAKWCLLLQLPSVEPAGLDWVEMSALYFWIQRDALAARDFSQVFITMQ